MSRLDEIAERCEKATGGTVSNWIKVADGKPKKSTALTARRVVVYIPELRNRDQDGFRFARWMGEPYGWLIDGCSRGFKVTHWMPLERPVKRKAALKAWLAAKGETA